MVEPELDQGFGFVEGVVVEPVDVGTFAFEFAEPDVLAFAELADVDEELVAHVDAAELVLEEEGDVAVFEAEPVKAFPRQALVVEALNFIDEAIGEALVESRGDAFVDDVAGEERGDDQGLL